MTKQTNPIFTPSSTDLLDMIRRAEARFEFDRQQAILSREAEASRKLVRAWQNEAEVTARRARWGY